MPLCGVLASLCKLPERSFVASNQVQNLEDLHFRVLKLLEANPDMSQRELASQLGVSNGKLNYCLRALIAKGWVKLASFAHSKHHLGYAYLLTRAGFARKATLTGRFLKRKLAEYDALRAEIESLQRELDPKLKRRGQPDGMNAHL